MSRFDDANAALQSRDWSNAQVDDKPRTASVVQSVRMPRELNERLLAEAHRRGVTPSEVIRDLVDAGLTASEESPTVRLSDVRRAIEALAHQVA
jgi:predicted DNA-binding protein